MATPVGAKKIVVVNSWAEDVWHACSSGQGSAGGSMPTCGGGVCRMTARTAGATASTSPTDRLATSRRSASSSRAGSCVASPCCYGVLGCELSVFIVCCMRHYARRFTARVVPKCWPCLRTAWAMAAMLAWVIAAASDCTSCCCDAVCASRSACTAGRHQLSTASGASLTQMAPRPG
jgi:hypothetical protein